MREPFDSRSRGMIASIGWALLACALVCFAGYAALFIAPEERTMKEIQRIFYFHLPSWITSFSAFIVAFVANVAYIATRKPKWDWLGVAGAEVGVTCCTIGLITGPIWAHPVWGVWWTWDARLTTTFVLWLLYITYLVLRGLLEDPERRATLSAIFGIFAFLDVPLVYMSNRLWRTQHPQPVILGGQGSGLNPTMGKVLVICIFAIYGVMMIVLWQRYALERLRHEYEELRFEAESRASDAASIGKGNR